MFDTVDLHPSDPVTDITTGVTALAAEDRGHWHATALSDRLVQLLEVRERFDAEITRLAGQWRQTRAWETDGALTPTAWLAHRSPIGRSKANRLVHTAAMTTEHPALGDALAAGDVTVTHVEVLTKVATPRRRHLVAEHLDTLLGAATVLSVDDFTTTTRRWAVLADDLIANIVHYGGTRPRRSPRRPAHECDHLSTHLARPEKGPRGRSPQGRQAPAQRLPRPR